MPQPASDLERAFDVIRSLRLKGPSDGPDAFTIPKDPAQRRELVDLIYDLADEHAARAVMDLPAKAYRVEFGPMSASSVRMTRPDEA